MRSAWRRTAAAAALCLLSAAACGAESVIHLKDGSTARGEIVSRGQDSVRLRVKFGTITYSTGEIDSIEEPKAPGAEAPASSADLRDVLVMNSGDSHRGLIVSETDDAVEMDLVMSGRNVSKTLLMRTRFSMDQVSEVRRLTDYERAAARRSIESALRKAEEDSRAVERIVIEPTLMPSLDGKRDVPCKKVELEHFTVIADTDDEFLKEAAHRLDKVFRAYKRHFGVDRNARTKVRVVIYNSMAQYYAAIGGEFANPAFYSPDLGLIAAGCEMADYRRAIGAIGEHHARLNAQLEKLRGAIDKARNEVRRVIDGYNRQLHHAGTTTPAGRRIMAAIRGQEHAWQLEVGKLEREAEGIQARIREYDRRNRRVFDDYVSHMLATLYHEGFHAFLDRFLFEEEAVEHVPRWLNEGLAQYFELARMEGPRFVLGQEDKMRLGFLRGLHRERRTSSLREVLTAGAETYMVADRSDRTEAEESMKHYFQAWLIVHTLGERHRLTRENFRAFVGAVAAGRDQVEAVAALAGMGAADLERLLEAKMGSSIRLAPAEAGK